MDFWRNAFSALPNAASTPLAFSAYVFVLVAWVIIAVRVKRNKQLLAGLEKLPESDRLKALELEMGAVQLRSGLSPNEWLRSRVQLYYFLGFCVICLMGVVVFAIAMARPGANQQSAVVAKSETNQQAALDETRITGKWHAIFKDTNYAPSGNQFFLTLKADGGRLFGTVTRVYNLDTGENNGYPHGISDGKVEGAMISFSYIGETKKQDGNGQTTELKDLFHGSVSGDAIHFIYQVEGEPPSEFTAKRVDVVTPTRADNDSK
jgi:hypothetical protein